MKKDLEARVLDRLNNNKDKKKRYNFTLSPNVKLALADWCKENNKKESAAIEALIMEMIPKKFFK